MRPFSVLIFVMIALLNALLSLSCKEDEPVGNGGTGYDTFSRIRDIRTVSDGGFMLAGWGDKQGLVIAYALLRTDAQGNELWSEAYGNHIRYEMEAMTLCSDGGVAITGASRSDSAGDEQFLARISSSGELEWEQSYGPNTFRGCGVAQTTDGGYVTVGGYIDTSLSYTAALVIKTTSAGDTMWTSRLAISSWAYDVKVLADGRIVVSGFVFGDMYCFILSSEGDLLQGNGYGGINAAEAHAITQTSDGGFILAGKMNGPNEYDFYIVRITDQLGLVWERTFGGPGYDVAADVCQTSDGQFTVVGFTSPNTIENPDAWILRLNSDGDSLWSVRYGQVGHEYAVAVQPTDDNGCVVAGDPAFLMKLNSAGEIIWTRNYEPE